MTTDFMKDLIKDYSWLQTIFRHCYSQFHIECCHNLIDAFRKKHEDYGDFHADLLREELRKIKLMGPYTEAPTLERNLHYLQELD